MRDENLEQLERVLAAVIVLAVLVAVLAYCLPAA